MSEISTKELLDAGCHFGHLTHKWSPKMAPYIFMEKDGIHLIDLNKTLVKIEEAKQVVKSLVKSGRKVLFVATKKQAKEIVEQAAKSVDMPFVTERWLGGMLTNFATVKKSIKKMQTIEKNMKDGTFEALAKKERLVLSREHEKLSKFFSGIENMHKLPALIFIVDVKKEHIAVAEALKLNIPTIGLVDTNSDPTKIDYVIPANDDSANSIQLIVNQITDTIKEALQEYKVDKEEEGAKKKAEKDSAQELEAEA
ncbi:MAG: 30S ribosomal protein S2 [Bacteroidia bacterium]|nr:30S ribosomal protein S2 [Bacteroidia bacterium]